MNKVILSADSTCDLGDELKSKYDVHYFPFHIILEGKDYKDNVDITTKELFSAYYERKALPQTAAINVAEYYDYFKDWVHEGYDVIHFCLGEALSSSYKNCVLAAEEFKSEGAKGTLYPLNSCNLSTGMSLQILEAGDRIKANMDAETIVKEVEAMVPKTHSSFILDTLDFMKAGGRCSAVAAFGANLLGLKPCIEVDNKDGSMAPSKKYRGSLDKVLVQYTKDKLAQYDNIKTDRIFITYSSIDPPEIADMVKKAILEEIPFKEVYMTNASCTISCHCGPNTLGILFMTE